MLRHVPSLTLVPYTTLFRSRVLADRLARGGVPLLPFFRALWLAVGVQQQTPAERAPAVLAAQQVPGGRVHREPGDRKSTRLNSSHVRISYAVFCLKKKNIHVTPFASLIAPHRHHRGVAQLNVHVLLISHR